MSLDESMYPSCPNTTYDEWRNWGDFLGTGYLRLIDYLPFEQARDFVRELNLKGQSDFVVWHKTHPHDGIPTNPRKVYAEQWISWGDWLGNGEIHGSRRVYRPYAEAKAFVRKLGIKNSQEWKLHCKLNKLPSDIRSDPRRYDEWESWPSFLGNENIKIEPLPFRTARAAVRKMRFKSQKEYFEWSDRPRNIPSDPRRVYQNCGWISWGDWLGTMYVANQLRDYLSFDDARRFVRKLKFSKQKEFWTWCKEGKNPTNIPASPHNVYKESGWVSYSHFLGTNRRKGGWLSFEAARKKARSLKFRCREDYKEYVNSHADANMPSSPDKVYEKSGWCGWSDFLGTPYKQRDIWTIK